MGRWRARLGLGAVVAALAFAPALAVAPALDSAPALAGPAAGVSADLAPADTGVLQVSPFAVQVSQALLTGVALGPGQQVSITHAAATAPVTAGLATFTTTERPDGTATLAALHESPGGDRRPARRDPRPDVRLAADPPGRDRTRPGRGHGGAAGVPTAAPGRAPGARGNVRAVPHSGPPASVTVRDTGSRPALTVRIEPQAGATVTTIEERQP